MDEKHYKLRFLPLFENDLNEIVDYIALQLKNPMAAEDFANEVQTAIRERTTCAEAFEPYHSSRERRFLYYRIYVKNYVVFYVVIGNVMEVRRIVYRRRNLSERF
ncbi:MAG: type II toxin-antitoxin system RelE/ParE family toxin [Clostridia bacterium]